MLALTARYPTREHFFELFDAPPDVREPLALVRQRYDDVMLDDVLPPEYETRWILSQTLLNHYHPCSD